MIIPQKMRYVFDYKSRNSEEIKQGTGKNVE